MSGSPESKRDLWKKDRFAEKQIQADELIVHEHAVGAESKRSFWKRSKDHFADKFSQPYPLDEEFIAADPVHGSIEKNFNDALKLGLVAGAVVAVVAGGYAWRFSKCSERVVIGLGCGGLGGFCIGTEASIHWHAWKSMQEAQAKFSEWLEKSA